MDVMTFAGLAAIVLASGGVGFAGVTAVRNWRPLAIAESQRFSYGVRGRYPDFWIPDRRRPNAPLIYQERS